MTPPSPSATEENSQSILSSHTNDAAIIREGEYSRNGDFHRNLDPNWNYYPIYINKIEMVDELLNQYGSPQTKTLDAGCGEGVLVDKYLSQGWDIQGFDKNYASQTVRQGLMTSIPFETGTFDQVMCLDVLEHLVFTEQHLALLELKRMVKPGGHLIVSVPNLAHFTARLKLMFRGRLLRTASIDHHPGDRPAKEYEAMIEEVGFKIIKRRGIFPTLPPIYRFVMRNPSKSANLLRFLRKLPIPPYWNFQVLFVCQAV
jgi:2-polyprenyl-3-methyl-5-hydroxy-6-metoxy-1,4-benzoquinol methylase